MLDKGGGVKYTMNMEVVMENLFVVIWWQGGRENGQWIRTDAWPRERAEHERARIERMGYRAMLENAARSLAVGLPEGYEA